MYIEKMLRLGAKNKETKEYVNISYASKKNKYVCPECDSDVILRKGEKNRVHFAHKRESGCEYYEHPRESQIHKEGKMVIKMLIENNQLELYGECEECKEKKEIKLPKYENGKSVVLEHSFRYDFYNNDINDDGELKIADVAYLDEENKIIWIFEILNTHKTGEGERPEPWNEIEVKELLKKKIKEEEKVEIRCCRKYTCEKCYERRYNELEQKELKELLGSEYLEWFIRYKLGQRIFNKKRNEHLRICFDADSKDDIENNNNIINLFSKYYEEKKIKLETRKGQVQVKFINKTQSILEDLSGCGTIEIIKYILKNIQKIYVTIELSKYETEYREEIKNRIYIDVNYNEKEKIKKNGGKWDIKVKKWYIDKDNKKKIEILKNYKEINVIISKINYR
jgi:hypothetical protein